jgi:hypothetical protein
MRARDFLSEGKNHPIICVDVQPEYAYFSPQTEETCKNIIQFVSNQTGPVLFFVNAEESGTSADTLPFIKQFWENSDVEDPDTVTNQIDWRRFQIVDKGYGHFRAWMDQGIAPALIIKTIRLMYQEKVNDSRELFGGQDSETYSKGMIGLLDKDYLIGLDDPIIINWTSIGQLKGFSGAYLVGGGRDQCLREVELLMNAFNIKYKVIASLVY